MKITRHTGPDIRHALRAVRDSLGADAVILATRRTSNGVEITAAMDFDADNVQDSTAAVSKTAFEPLPLPQHPLKTPAPQPPLQLPSIIPPAPVLSAAAEPMPVAAAPAPRPEVASP